MVKYFMVPIYISYNSLPKLTSNIIKRIEIILTDNQILKEKTDYYL